MDQLGFQRLMFDPDKGFDFDINENTMVFADTTDMQKLLQKYNYQCPNTYDKRYNDFYHRNIQKMTFKDAKELEKPFFIKPYDNNKSFESIVVTENRDFEYLHETEGVENNDNVYTSDVVKFMNEHRLFLGPNHLFGQTESSEFILDSETEISKEKPPEEFIEKIIKNTQEYCVIDVGHLETGKWVVVEVNPPFYRSPFPATTIQSINISITVSPPSNTSSNQYKELLPI